MNVTEHIHALRVPFRVPVSHDRAVDRNVYIYPILGETITLVDSGVWGAHATLRAYLEQRQRPVTHLSCLILTHSHPDHLGGARALRDESDLRVLAHAAEKSWIEDTNLQFQERPVPGFFTLVEGPVPVDQLLSDGEDLDLDERIQCRVLHTPGHSKGSISLHFRDERVLVSGDAIPVPGDLPIYEDIRTSVRSIRRLRKLEDVGILLSSWEAPIHGEEQVGNRLDEGLLWLKRIHETVLAVKKETGDDGAALCQEVVHRLGMPAHAANPLVARGMMSSLEARDLFSEDS